MAALVIALLLAMVAGLCVSTMVGARRRGCSWVVTVLSGLAFPITWVRWYVEDELPRLAERRART